MSLSPLQQLDHFLRICSRCLDWRQELRWELRRGLKEQELVRCLDCGPLVEWLVWDTVRGELVMQGGGVLYGSLELDGGQAEDKEL